MRLDTELTARKLFSSRQKAKNAVVNGLIKVDGVVSVSYTHLTLPTKA